MVAPLVQNPTYLLAPNWTFPPGGPIDLGNIIADPFRPHLVLTRPASDGPQPSIQKVRETDWQLQVDSGLNLTVGLWAKFVDNVGAKIRLQYKHRLGSDYSMVALETVYYTDMPTLAQVQERVKDPDIHELLRLDNLFSRPVYMVTGLKIARGFRLSSKSSSSDGGVGEAGGEIDVAVAKAHEHRFKSETDIIFAYQLMRIAAKGWKEKTLKLTEYHPSAAFLGDNEEQEQVLEVESEFPQVSDLKELGTVFSDMTVTDGTTEYVCIAFEEEDD